MEMFIDLVEKNYIPDIRENIILKFSGTPVTNFDFVKAPFGSAYGATMKPSQVGLNRLKATTPWRNFYWSNQSAGYSGMAGTVGTGLKLYATLTGDDVMAKAPKFADEEIIAQMKQ